MVGGCEEKIAWTNGSMQTRLQSFANEAPKRGRARRADTHPSSAISLRHKVHVACIRKAEWCWDLSAQNMQTPKRLTRVAIDAVGAMKSGETVIWDRVGVKWACCESEQRALQPGGERSIRGAWRVDQVLASEGQVFNPLELLFNDLKQHYIRPNFPKNGRPLSKSKIAYSRVRE